MITENMLKETLEDFTNYQISNKCRHYCRVINALRSIPCGVGNRNNINEFYEFLDTKSSKSFDLVEAVKIVFEFYLGYSIAQNSEDIKKLSRRLYAKKYYLENKSKMKAIAKISYDRNKDRKIKQMQKYRENNRDLWKYKYSYTTKPDKDRIYLRTRVWRLANKDKLKMYAMRYRLKQKRGNQ